MNEETILKIMAKITTAIDGPETPLEKKRAIELIHQIYVVEPRTERQIKEFLRPKERSTTPISDALKEIEESPDKESVDFIERNQPTPRPKQHGEYKRDGRTFKVQQIVIERLNHGEPGILIQTLEKELGFTNGLIWGAMAKLIKSLPDTYEYYRDNTTRYKLKGIRYKQEESK